MISSLLSLHSLRSADKEVQKHDYTQHDTIISKYFKIMLFDISHEEFDLEQRNYKRYHHSYRKSNGSHHSETKTAFNDL